MSIAFDQPSIVKHHKPSATPDWLAEHCCKAGKFLLQ
jgi:hypothetical protein